MEQRVIVMVRASISPEKEEAFNRWYNEDHLQKAVRFPGCLGASRYKIIKTGGANLREKIDEERFRYMAIYEYESLAARDALLKTGSNLKLVEEFNKAWPESERLWTTAIRIFPY